MPPSKSLKERHIAILKLLQENCKLSLEDMAKLLKEPKSTIFYTLKEMEKRKYILGYQAKLNPKALGYDFTSIMFVRARYTPGYHREVGEKLAKIRGVRAVYFVFGNIDFILIITARNREQYLKILEEIMKVKGVVRTSSHIVADTIKEEFSFDLSLLSDKSDKQS